MIEFNAVNKDFRHSANLILFCDFYDFLIRHFKKTSKVMFFFNLEKKT